MNFRKKTPKVAIVLFWAMVFACAALGAAESSTAVRVGFFAFDGYHMEDADGTRSGYGYDVLQHMAGYAGFDYEYVGYDCSWSEMQDLLENGEIDLVTSAQMTEDRLTRFDYSKTNIGLSSAILTKRAGNTSFYLGDYGNWNGIRVGMIEGNSRNDSFSEFARQHGFTYETVFFDSTEEMKESLLSGQGIDAILTSSLRRITGETILAQFDSSPFYVIVRKGNQELLDRIDYALEMMDSYEPGFRTKLMNEYYPSMDPTAISYSIEEQTFIDDSRGTVFRAVINPDRAPYSYLEGGKLTGSVFDIANEIIERSGLDIEWVLASDRAEYQELLEGGEFDLQFDALDDYNKAEKSGCWLTPAYLTIPVSRLSLDDSVTFESAALVRGSNIASNYSEILAAQGIDVVFYDCVQDCIEAVMTGKQDFALLLQNTATLAVRDDIRNKLVAETYNSYSTVYAIAVRNSDSPLLFSVMSKAAASISTGDIDTFNQKYAESLVKSFSVTGFFYDYPIRAVLIVLGILLIVFMVVELFSLARRRAKAAEQVTQEKEANERLQQALDRAEKADAAKSNFMSRMSHEIRTPLNAIIGYNTIANSELSGARAEADRRAAEMRVMDCLSKSEIASRHLLTIINDVLDMSAIDSGRIKIAHDPFDFRELVSSLTAVFYPQARRKGVELEVTFDTHLEEWFTGDQMRTNQILTNLLGNAIKFTSRGGSVRLRIQCMREEEKLAFISFDVTDTGIGMSEEYLTHIWNPFEQADSSISRRFGGTGLGLSITKNLVELMHGKISVQSEVGKGSAFHVELPFSRAVQPSNSDTYDFAKINALVVDDDTSSCDYTKLLFTRFEARCITVNSGYDAVELFEQKQKEGEPFNLCLVDWKMPEMDGIETVKRIRKLAGAKMPIVVFTAYDFSEIKDQAVEAGVSSFIAKPVFQSTLFNLLANLSGKPRKPLAERTKKYKFSGQRVLLVEDNKMNMEIARRILEATNLTVDCVWNGKEAVKAFEASPEGKYSVILMDVQMPVMDGHQATRTIRASEHPEARTIPIIAMTADAFSENVSEALAAGMNAHVSKPIEISVLFETLMKYL